METPIISADIFLYVLAGIVVVLVIWIIFLQVKLNRFLKGKNAKTLEDSFISIQESADKQVIINKEIAKEIDRINGRLQTSIRGFETIRFNAFEGTGSGGNQSFAIALMNEENNGMILSSLYSRDRFSAFAKPIKNGKSEFELTKEEAQALLKAEEHLSGK
jgi:hypothetical protein